MSTATEATRAFRTEECGFGRSKYWFVRIDGRRDAIGIVEPRDGDTFEAYCSGRSLGRFPSLDDAAKALVQHDAQERRR